MKQHFVPLISVVVAALAAGSMTGPLSAADGPTVLITGSNRGIGLELTRIYAQRGWNVIATCRAPGGADELQSIAAEFDNVTIEELDVTDDSEIKTVAEKYANQPIDILINNAGIAGDRDRQLFGKFDFDVYDEVMAVNVIGPLKMAQAFISHVEASDQKKIINISSTQGSIASTVPGRGNSYFYKSSKSALNMVMHILAIELKDRGITVGLVSPGWVDTNFGGLPSLQGMITAEESAASVASVIDTYGIESSGTLITHEGAEAPW